VRKSLLLACALLALVPLACQSFHQGLNPYPPEFLRVMTAAEKVLGRHFVITGVDKAHGVVGAASVVRANTFTKYRTRAEARIYPVGLRVYDVQVRVTNELEISEPSLLGRGQPGYDWRAMGFDHVLEAALMTEVQAELQGKTVSVVPPGYSNFLKPSAPKARHRDLFKAPPPPPPPPKPAPEPKSQSNAPDATVKAEPEPAALYAQYLALGDVYGRRREHKKALLEYQRATLARQDAAAAHLSLATVFTALSRYDAAAAALRDAAKASGDQSLNSYDLKRLKTLAEDLSERLLTLKGWCKQNPKDADAQLLLGYHCLLAERTEEARKTLGTILEASPKDPAAAYLLRQIDKS